MMQGDNMSRLVERLAKKIHEQLRIDCDTETFVRTYAGRNQKAAGAPLWLMRPKNDSIVMIGSTLPASYLVKKGVSLCAEKSDYGTFIELFDEE